MNFKITYNWLQEYLETDATPEQIQKYVSLGGPNVETIEKYKDDFVFDIEVTSNRIDAASVFGFAQECAAILPRYDIQARLKENPLEIYTFKSLNKPSSTTSLPCEVVIDDSDLAERVTVITLKNINVRQSSELVKGRLEAIGIQSINNVVDISNYVMVALGQPNHTFDYDAMGSKKLVIRRSKKGETITTLDNKDFKLPGNDIVVEDAHGDLVDLAGIMGGLGSSITHNTKNVLVILETYNKNLLRRTSMRTGQRSMAVSYFEKGLDPKRIEPSLVYEVKLLQEHAGGMIASPVIDLYKEPSKDVHVDVSVSYINNLMNTSLDAKEIASMINPLGFSSTIDGDHLNVRVPSYRAQDVDSQADIAEEVARVYGYANIASEIQQTNVVYQPLQISKLIDAKYTLRDYLRAVGYNEQYNYSMISKKQIEDLDYPLEQHLRLKNTISTDIEYMRFRLVPSLLKNIQENEGHTSNLHFFELARVYKKREGDLPLEDERLGIMSTADFYTIKGDIENILKILRIDGVHFEPSDHVNELVKGKQAVMLNNSGENVGHIGQLNNTYKDRHNLRNNVISAEIRFGELVKDAKDSSKYIVKPKYAVIKLDLTYTSSPDNIYASIKKTAYETSAHLQDIAVLDKYEDKVTLRFSFQDKNKNMTEDEAKNELEKIKGKLNL